MAKIGYWAFPPEWEPLIKKILKWNDRFFFTSVRRNNTLMTRKRLSGLSQRSLQPAAALEWQNLPSDTKSMWAEAAQSNAQTSFQLYLQEYAQSIKHEIEVPLTPSIFAQNNCGRCMITFPAAGFVLMQEHPYQYFVQRKVTGTRDQMELVSIIEDFDFPFKVGLSYRTELEALSENAKAVFLIEVLSHYQGQDIVTPYEVELPLVSDWHRIETTLKKPIGKPKEYIAYIDVLQCQGVIDFDNILLHHSGQNWARDFRCNNIRTNVTRSFIQIAKHWDPIIMPAGVFYDSIYYKLN